MLNRITKIQIKSLQAIQKNAVGIIYKQPHDAYTKDLGEMSELMLLTERMQQLNARYFESAKQERNGMIERLKVEYERGFTSVKEKMFSLLTNLNEIKCIQNLFYFYCFLILLHNIKMLFFIF